MTLAHSTMVPLGTLAPNFELVEVRSGETVSLTDFAYKKALVVVFISRQCPFVQHVKSELGKLGRDYKGKNVGMVAIASNDIQSSPEDSPDSLREFARELNLPFPLLYDPQQTAAKDFFAACTPDFFVFDGERKLAYRGQLDDSHPENGVAVTGKDLRLAIHYVVCDEEINWQQKPSLGSGIAWKPGREPVYCRVSLKLPVISDLQGQQRDRALSV